MCSRWRIRNCGRIGRCLSHLRWGWSPSAARAEGAPALAFETWDRKRQTNGLCDRARPGNPPTGWVACRKRNKSIRASAPAEFCGADYSSPRPFSAALLSPCSLPLMIWRAPSMDQPFDPWVGYHEPNSSNLNSRPRPTPHHASIPGAATARSGFLRRRGGSGGLF